MRMLLYAGLRRLSLTAVLALAIALLAASPGATESIEPCPHDPPSQLGGNLCQYPSAQCEAACSEYDDPDNGIYYQGICTGGGPGQMPCCTCLRQ